MQTTKRKEKCSPVEIGNLILEQLVSMNERIGKLEEAITSIKADARFATDDHKKLFDKIGDMADDIDHVETKVDDLSERVEDITIIAAEDLATDLEEHLKPTIEEHAKSVDDSCRKMTAFLLRYFNMINRKNETLKQAV